MMIIKIYININTIVLIIILLDLLVHTRYVNNPQFVIGTPIWVPQ